MNYIDIIILVTVLLGFFIGWKLRGIFMIIIPIAFLAGIVTANFGHVWLAKLLAPHVSDPSRSVLFSYLIIFILASSLIVFVGVAITHFFEFMSLAFIDRILGSILLITLLLVPVYLTFNFLGEKNLFNFKKDLKKSLTYPVVKAYSKFIFRIPVAKEAVKAEKIIKSPAK